MSSPLPTPSATAILQQDFQDYVLQGTADDEQAARFVSQIVDGPRIGAQRRLTIYADAYRARLVEVLASDYSSLKAFAGDELFADIAQAYIAAHPSRHPNARWFGGFMPDFIRKRFSARPEWADMAAFEWAMSLAFDAPDSELYTFEQLAALAPDDWPDLRFNANPSLQRLELFHDVAAFHLALQRDEASTEIVQWDAARPWIVWRRDLRVWYRPLEDDEAWALDFVRGGGTFAALCEGLGTWHTEDDVPLHAVGLLKAWVEDGLLAL